MNLAFTAREFSLPGGVIRAIGYGAGRRRILAVHGWLDNAASFMPLAPMIDDATIVAVDLAGHGHSDHRPAGAAYQLVDYVPDLAGVVEALGWREFTLLGHSLGAGIGSLFAAAFADRLQALCLIDGLGPISGREDDAPARLRRAVDAQLAVPDPVRGGHHSIQTAVRARLAATRMNESSARLIVERNLRPVDGGYAWRTDRRLMNPSPLYLSQAQVHAFLAAVACPALLVMAEDGVIASRDSTAGRIAVMPNLRVHRLPGHHHLHMDDPAPVAALVNAFLDEVDRENDGP